MSEPQVETQEEREVREATEALAASKRKLALAEEARLSKAAADLAAHKIEQERQLHEAQLAREATEKKWAEEKQRKADALKAEQAAQEAQKAALESALAKEEEAKRQREAHTARLAKIEAERFQAEQDAARIQRELQQASSPKVEPAPPTLATTPLSILFGGHTEGPAQSEGLSSEQNAHAQAELDRGVTKEPSRKAHPTVDITTSNDLVALVKRELRINLNTQRADALSSQWTYEALLSAGHQVIEYAKSHPCGHDQICSMLEATLEAQQ